MCKTQQCGLHTAEFYTVDSMEDVTDVGKLESNEKEKVEETKPLDNTPVVVEVMKPPEKVLVNASAVFDRSPRPTHSMISSDSIFLEQI